MRRFYLCIALILAPVGFVSAGEIAVVTTTDYTSGNLAAISDGETTARTDLLPIHSDNWVVAWGGYVYVLERLGGDNIIKLSPDDLSSPIYQKSVGDKANPYDVAFVDEHKAYVSRYGRASVLIIDPATGDSTGSVDLSAYVAYAGTDSAESVPHMAYMAISDGKLYIACQRLKGWNPGDTSLIAVIDTQTDQVLESIPLNLKNPVALSLYEGRLYIACVGSWWDPTDGGIEVVDTATDRNLGVLVDESALGGNVSGVLVVSPGKGYALVMAQWPNIQVKPFDPQEGTAGEALPGATAAVHMAVSSSGRLYVADRSEEAPGIYIYDISDDELVAGSVPTGLPPNSVAIVGVPTAVAETEGSLLLSPSLALPFPNPFNSRAVVPYVLGEDGYVRLAVYDMLGRKVRVLFEGRQEKGLHRAYWDGRDEEGRSVASGIYILKLEAGGKRWARTLSLIR
ncbi:MAG TPA: T9SS type A sorting domain-containing protein [Candidatus Latescibacteria bacterium]|nr:T9SS type A sorting domain-containing protein [Candidatus Latescibacterota bacterium]